MFVRTHWGLHIEAERLAAEIMSKNKKRNVNPEDLWSKDVIPTKLDSLNGKANVTFHETGL